MGSITLEVVPFPCDLKRYLRGDGWKYNRNRNIRWRASEDGYAMDVQYYCEGEHTAGSYFKSIFKSEYTQFKFI